MRISCIQGMSAFLQGCIRTWISSANNGPQGLRVQRSYHRLPALLVLAAALLGYTERARAQAGTDIPSDVSPGLAYVSLTANTTPLPATCPAGALNPSTGDFTLAGATPTSQDIVGFAPCGNYFTPPPPTTGSNPAHDRWFRLDPPTAPTYFRFTLFAGAAPAMVQGGMALYQAPSAAGPFQLVECAEGGNALLSGGLATLETRSSITPGNKLYVRVWDRQNRASSANFRICVQGQEIATMLDRKAAETACDAPLIAASALSNTGSTSIDYVFAQEEENWLFTDSASVGGDLWIALEIPNSGSAIMAVGRGSASLSTVWNIGISAYTTSNCSDPTQFRQVANFNSLPTSTGFPSIAGGPGTFAVSCLQPGEKLYLRIHSIRSAQAARYRYGTFRFAWIAGGTTGTPPTNNSPCSATPLSFNASCPATPSGANNFNACNTPGIPNPGCGGFDRNTRDVWYSFVAPTSGTIQLDATAGTGFPANPAMALYATGGNGCHGRFTLIDCDANMGPGNGARIIRTGLVPGETYYVRAWAEGDDAMGSFDICITEPVPPAGSCFYLIRMFGDRSTPWLAMDVSVDGGPNSTYTTTPGDNHELFLISIPTGSSASFNFRYDPLNWRTDRQVFRLGSPDPLWHTWSGGAVVGPGTTPVYDFTLSNACAKLTPPSTDCLGLRTVCTALSNGSNTTFGDLSSISPPGNSYDLLAANMGCLPDERLGIEWLAFRPAMAGTVAFYVRGAQNPTLVDVDFAVWDTGPAPYSPAPPNVHTSVCAPLTPPVRCSSARRTNSTGLQPGLRGVASEGTGGWGWLSPLPVEEDHVYLIAVVRGPGGNAVERYELRWTQYVNEAGISTPGMLDCEPMILPVDYLFLEAQAAEAHVDVLWATGSERNSAYFIVERSLDGRSFSPIGEVEAAGISLNRTDYHFVDPDPAAGNNYYRLVQVDLDGIFELSKVVVAVMGERKQSLVLFPNPASDQVEIILPDAGHATLLLITDAMGRTVLTRQLPAQQNGDNRLRFDVTGFSAGIYQVQISDPTGRSVGSARLIKK